MKTIVFDAGPIISLALNGLLYVLKDLKRDFDGVFALPHQARKELIDNPYHKRRFQFEALQILELIRDKTLKVYNVASVKKKSQQLLMLANSIYSAHGNKIQLVHGGEIEAIGLALQLGAHAIVIDERTTRYLLEKPAALHRRLERKLHTKVSIDKKKLAKFKAETRGIKVLRSTELVMVAFEKGLLNRYKPNWVNADKAVIESVLWALKMRGCAISDDELFQLVKMES
jgi:predicted nucleic acid-binding protein